MGIFVALSLIAESSIGHHVASAQVVQQTGVTITPAALTLDLPAGELEASTTFQVTNHYNTPVTLAFSVETDPHATSSSSTVLDQLLFGTPEVHIASGQTVSQTLALFDSQTLAPGGQQLTVVVQQQGQASASAVGVTASMRLPLTIVKESGAITRLSLTTLTGPSLTIGLPKNISATLHNSGNMIAIPHGVVKIIGSNGSVLSQGTVNVASIAMAPGQSSSFSTPLTTLRRPTFPGIYHAQFSYGLGGDTTPQVVSVGFVYVAWWHLAVLALVGVGAYAGVRQFRQRARGYSRKRMVAHRSIRFAKRGAT